MNQTFHVTNRLVSQFLFQLILFEFHVLFMRFKFMLDSDILSFFTCNILWSYRGKIRCFRACHVVNWFWIQLVNHSWILGSALGAFVLDSRSEKLRLKWCHILEIFMTSVHLPLTQDFVVYQLFSKMSIRRISTSRWLCHHWFFRLNFITMKACWCWTELHWSFELWISLREKLGWIIRIWHIQRLI